MREFTGFEYVKIAVANAYGLDRENWDTRLDWFERHISHLDIMGRTAKQPIEYAKAVKAFWDSLNRVPSGYLMPLDATASGLQIFAALTGCKDTARNTNLIGGFDRMCPYENTAKTLSLLSHKKFERDEVKRPLMTTFYGSLAQPKEVFGEDTEELKCFYETLKIEFAGAIEALADIQSCWQSDVIAHTWVMPDGHTVYIPVRDSETKVIEVDSLAGLKFSMTAEVIRPMESGISLAANIIHSKMME